MSSNIRRSWERVRRHWRWGRRHGFRRLVEEDELNPFARASNAYGRWRWRSKNPIAEGTAMPVYLVGAQRSGTNMLVRGFQTSPEFEVYNENNRRAFSDFRLRSDETIAEIIARSRHRYVLFKPLIDSHRIDHLLDELPVATPGRALWAYRNVDGRVRSALAKFGDTNLRALKDIAGGTGGGRWEAQRLSPENLELIRSFNYDAMDPASGSALFWFVRNSLFFELKLNERPDVLLVSYDSFVLDPDGNMRAVCEHIGFPWSPHLTAHVAPRAPGNPKPLALKPEIRRLCNELQDRLTAAEQGGREQGVGR